MVFRSVLVCLANLEGLTAISKYRKMFKNMFEEGDWESGVGRQEPGGRETRKGNFLEHKSRQL